MTLTDHSSISIASVTILVVALLRFLVKLFQVRRNIWRLRNQGLVRDLGMPRRHW